MKGPDMRKECMCYVLLALAESAACRFWSSSSMCQRCHNDAMMAARVQVGDLGVAPGVREVGWWPQGGGRSKASGNSTSRFTIDLPQVYHDKRVTSSGIMVRRHVRVGPAPRVCRVDRCVGLSLDIRWVSSSHGPLCVSALSAVL